ncbi:MAG: hypothetical protein KA206_00660 [Paludibacter sp.]|nr:hypothetical protein [Paludibacter sp.]
MFANHLTLNVLRFTMLEEKLCCYISTQEGSGAVKLSQQDTEYLVAYLKFPPTTTVLYTTFEEACVGAKAVTFYTAFRFAPEGERCWSAGFLRKYYTHCLCKHFRTKGLIVRSNFLSDLDVWLPAKSSPYPNCMGYRGFRLRVQFGAANPQPCLLLSYDGIHSVSKKSLTDDAIEELSPELFSWVLYENRLYRYAEMPDDARRNAENVYPCLNKALQRALHIPFPAPDKSNRYLRYREEIEAFRKAFLYDNALGSFMNIEPDWEKRESYSLLSENNKLNMLEFGNGHTDTEPKNGIKHYGPRDLSPDVKTVFFFICHRQDVNMASTVNAYLKGSMPGFYGLRKYTGIAYSIVKGFSIYFDDKESPLVEIAAELDKRSFESGTRYVALYLSPYGKWDAYEAHRKIYYQVKEELLHRGIVSQVIEVEKNWIGRKSEVKADNTQLAILKNGFNFAFANIAVALLAKLGGTPWSLAGGVSNELVIGISAFNSDSLDHKYLGSAFSFSGEGSFCGFDCFRSNQMDELAGSILMAVKSYCEERDALDRLVIHFYKTLSKKELAPIEAGLSKLGLDIPVVVVSVNKTFSEDILGFDDSQSHLMPYSFSYFPINKYQYLLYNNGLQKDLVFDAREGYPFPLKLSVQYFAAHSTESIQANEELIPALFEQVCRFSQLYWKSVSRQSLPVTLRYPEMLAQIVPHFTRPELPRTGKETLWFL